MLHNRYEIIKVRESFLATKGALWKRSRQRVQDDP
jgi:hypothetical protein